MRIGISVLTHASQNIWSNGLGQNVIFLAQLLQRVPFVTSVVLIDCGDQGAMPPQVDMGDLGLRIMSMRDATDEVDVVIEMAGALDSKWIDLMRARGRKVVFHCCGQPFVALAEPVVFNKQSTALRPDRCDEVWYLPKDEAFAPMLRTIHRCDAHAVPFIWSPQFLEARAKEVAETGYRYGYVPREASPDAARSGWRVAIFEPNISVVKTSSIPMLVCDEAYRADRDSVQMMHVLNALHIKDHPTMLYLANSLDIVKTHRATFHGRHDIVGFMVQFADAVVSHQWGNNQNYSYLDALYGDYPLIHNSPWLKDVGYYYPDFDAQEGGAQLRRAEQTHDTELPAYRARAQRLFQTVDPLAHHNVEQYAARLTHLCRGTSNLAATGGRA
ncbi:DUF2827 domain-containing protein [Paraburkholderia ferrariae]|uniref:DUF2827 domain-containing protein n=1 Tax=Paraburkholderia ferrariae TaxID=386056 RepID=UPI000485EBC8|nr:DUF2827 domain-containing protein [Paraburkholderia ferrariae]